MKRYIPLLLLAIAALAVFAGAPGASAAARKLATYTAPGGEWSVQYPADLLHAEQLSPDVTIFISKDRHTVAAIDAYTLAGSIKPSALNARGMATLRTIYKDVKNTGAIGMPGARWETGFGFATAKGSLGAARYHQNGRVDRDYRVFGFVYGYKAADEKAMLPILQAIGESLKIEPPAARRLGQARDALRAFLAALEAGRYDDADALYGGSYAVLKTWNPGVPASNHIKLLRLGCTQNGLNCLRLKRVVGETAISASEYHFVAELMNADGTVFVQGPCCGDTTGPTISRFAFTMKNVGGAYLVQDLPPYTP